MLKQQLLVSSVGRALYWYRREFFQALISQLPNDAFMYHVRMYHGAVSFGSGKNPFEDWTLEVYDEN